MSTQPTQSKFHSSQSSISQITFGTTLIPLSQVFLIRKNVFAIVNHKPIVRGHVVVAVRRQVAKMEQLTEVQCLDLFLTAQQVCQKLSPIYHTYYNIHLQNGIDAGQSVPQVYLQLIPQIDSNNYYYNNGQPRQIRSQDDMAKEAEQYRQLFQQTVGF